MKRNIFVYVIIIGVFMGLMYLIIDKGKHLKVKQETTAQTSVSELADKAKPVAINSQESVWQQFLNNIHHPMSLLLQQIIIILLVSRVFGILASKLGQQTVIGEIIAGIFLGPSIMGWISHDFYEFIFPKDSLKLLQFLSQIGLAFFMFIIGMELDISKLKNKAKDAIVVSHASIVFPYFLGMLLAYFIYEQFAPAGVSFLSFSLFMGIAMSITAFPVLARIIQERGLTKTPLGALAITCAAADDITAWCILAAVIAIVKAGSIVSALFTIGLAILFVIFMLYVMKPLLRKKSAYHISGEKIDKTVVAISLFILLLSAYFAEVIGIHALFGAFIAGTIVPHNERFKELLAEKIEDISVLLLLPVFFAFTGLRTRIGLLTEGHLWALCGVVIMIAVVGKLGGSTLAAKIVGRSWKDSLSIGAMMNTRGLMELIVLNIGYDLGILTPEIFAIMVLMALVTTFMTGPSLDLINYSFRDKTVSKPATVL